MHIMPDMPKPKKNWKHDIKSLQWSLVTPIYTVFQKSEAKIQMTITTA